MASIIMPAPLKKGLEGHTKSYFLKLKMKRAIRRIEHGVCRRNNGKPVCTISLVKSLLHFLRLLANIRFETRTFFSFVAAISIHIDVFMDFEATNQHCAHDRTPSQQSLDTSTPFLSSLLDLLITSKRMLPRPDAEN